MAADESVTTRIKGMDELRKELAKLDEKTFTNELKDAHKAVAQLVVGKAKARAGLPVQRKAAGSLRASRTVKTAQVSYGGEKFPFAFGAEFGSNKYRQFPPHLGRTGYFLYPAIRSESAHILEIYGEAVDKITKRAFPD